jgi:xylulose-5-phosphate/fructose-6-phosphate phosphoketolase
LVVAEIQKIQTAARSSPNTVERPRWPMIVFRTPKGWTGPKFVDGKPVEGTWRAYQVPLGVYLCKTRSVIQHVDVIS